MTRADIVRNIINDDGYYYTKHSVLEIVNVIFDEHEADIKDKDKLTLEKSELQSKINIKNVELDIAKRDLEEAHEMAGVLFLEAMAVTDSYNELKNKCKKVKR